MAKSSHAGRPGSWLSVGVMLIGFVAGGIALTMGPAWWLFWTALGLVALGGIVGLALGILDDVIIDGPRVFAEEPHHSERTGARGEVTGPGTATDAATTHTHG